MKFSILGRRKFMSFSERELVFASIPLIVGLAHFLLGKGIQLSIILEIKHKILFLLGHTFKWGGGFGVFWFILFSLISLFGNLESQPIETQLWIRSESIFFIIMVPVSILTNLLGKHLIKLS